MPQLKNSTGILAPREEEKLRAVLASAPASSKTPLEMTKAIKRQRIVRGLDYRPPNKQPVLRALVSGLSGLKLDTKNTGSKPIQLNSESSTITRPAQPGQGSKHGRTLQYFSFVDDAGLGYSITYKNQSNTLNAQIVEKQFEKTNATDQPKLSLTVTGQTPRKFKYRHSSKESSGFPEWFTRRLNDKTQTTNRSYNNDVKSAIDLTSGHEANGAISQSTPNDPSTTKSNTALPEVREERTKLAKKQNGKWTESPKKPAQTSCLDFADSVIGALKSDLSHMTQLCSQRVPYAEFIETTEPHRLSNRANQTTESFKAGQSASKGQSAITSQPATSSRSSNDTSSRGPRFSKAKPDFDSSSVTMPTDPSGEKKEEDSNTEIDYDKPIQIIIESNDNDERLKNTKPILKSNQKNQPVSSTNETIPDGNNNRVSVLPNIPQKNSNLTDSITNDSVEWRARYLSDSVDDPGNAMSQQIDVLMTAKEKGRLVRFSAQHQIHEFVPFDKSEWA